MGSFLLKHELEIKEVLQICTNKVTTNAISGAFNIFTLMNSVVATVERAFAGLEVRLNREFSMC